MAKRGKRATGLNHWLGQAGAPVFVLDLERRIAAFNAACEMLTGWTVDEILGEIAHYGSVSEIAGAAALAASLCPPPEVFAGRELTTSAYLVHKDGRALPQRLYFFPLTDEQGAQTGVLGIVMPFEPPVPAMETSPARQLHAELAALRSMLRTRFGPGTIVAQSATMKRVLAQLALAQSSRVPVLIEGEQGTGKEHLARMIHFGGPDKGHWFVPLDCRRLTADELDRVWTRLVETPRSPVATAAGPQPGTVFLTDVDALPRDLQERLVRHFPLNDPSRWPPLRILSASAVPLKSAAAAGNIRNDFLALVSPLIVEVPPLRERGDDIPLLSQHFVEELNRQETKQVAGFDDRVWPLFARYHWPANLDELAAVVRDAHAHATGTLITPDDLPFRFRNALEARELPPPPESQPIPLDDLLTRLETRLLTLALERTKNNKSKAAELLGINRARLLRRIEQLGLDKAGPEESIAPTDSLKENGAGRDDIGEPPDENWGVGE